MDKRTIWVISIKKTYFDVSQKYKQVENNIRIFESFDKAIKEIKDELKNFVCDEKAFTEEKNRLFTDDGLLRSLNWIIYNLENGNSELDLEDLLKIEKILQNIFNGKKSELTIKQGAKIYDWLTSTYDNNILTLYYGDIQGRQNEPLLQTNMFDMREEKDYFLYINDSLINVGRYSAIYIDLQKVEIEK